MSRREKRKEPEKQEYFAVKFYGPNTEDIPEDYPWKVYKLKDGALPYEGYEEIDRDELIQLMTLHSSFRERLIQKKKLIDTKKKKLMDLKSFVNQLGETVGLDSYPESIQKSFTAKVIEAEEYLSLKRDKTDCYILFEEAKEAYNVVNPSDLQMVQLCEKVISKSNGDTTRAGFKKLIGRISGRYSRLVNRIEEMEDIDEVKRFPIKSSFKDIIEMIEEDGGKTSL
ncbi:MAG: hypothetical protein H7A25_07440 [Leptospiraceae bacterium]|nr:hypothetical protein [Leptospiraceae bacterium]